MLKLKKIKIQGFILRSGYVNFDFADSETNTTVMFGFNGSGKTTLIRIIHAIFSKNEIALANNQVRKIELECELNQKDLHINIEEKTTFDDIELDTNHDVHYDWTEYDKSGLNEICSMVIGIERASTINSSNVPFNVIYDFFLRGPVRNKFFSEYSPVSIRNLSHQLAEYINYNNGRLLSDKPIDVFQSKSILYKGLDISIRNIESRIVNRYSEIISDTMNKITIALSTTFAQIIGKKKKYDEQDFQFVKENYKKYCKLITDAIKQMPDQNRNDDILHIFEDSSCDEIVEECKQNKQLCLLVKNIIDNIIPAAEKLNSVNMLTHSFNKFTNGRKKIHISNSGIIVENGESHHSIDKLSSGEKQFLTLLTCIIIDDMKRDLIMIDEPEISLNLDWQGELIDLINSCSPGTQVVLATHSPAVADEHMECLKKIQWKC